MNRVVALLLACSGFGYTADPPALGDWPLWRGNANSDGTSEVELPKELNERWVYKCRDSVDGAAAVVGQVCYVASTDKHLHAIDLAKGKELWKKKLGIMKASPSYREGKLVVGNIEGKVFCLDAKTGDQLWAFDNESGEISSGCSFHGDSTIVAAQGMPVTCLNAKGEKVWAFEIDGGSNGTPTVVGDICFASGCDSHFHAIDAKTGKELWKLELPGQAAATPAIRGSTAYIGTVTNQVVAIDLKEKTKLWQFEAPRKSQPFYSSCAVTDKLVLAGSRDKKLYALDAKTGEEVWSAVTEGSIDASPVIAGSKVYVGCQSLTGEFYVFDLATGKSIQELTLDSAVTGSVAVTADGILVGTEKGSVYHFGK